MPKPEISKQTITKATKALLKWLSSNSPEDKSIYLILSLKQTPHSGRSLSFTLPLPHPIHPSFSLVFDDRPIKSTLSLSSIQIAITPLSLPHISIYPFSNKELLPEDGLLLVDKSISRKLPRSKNGGKRMVVVEINFKRKDWVDEVRKHVYGTCLKFNGGTCCGIKVGREGQSLEEIVENVEMVAVGAVECVPKKWRNVRGFHVKAAESVSLPVFEEVGDGNGGMKRKMEDSGEVVKKSKVVA